MAESDSTLRATILRNLRTIDCDFYAKHLNNNMSHLQGAVISGENWN